MNFFDWLSSLFKPTPPAPVKPWEERPVTPAADLIHAASEFIAKWESFSNVAYWDVNHWRLGYGSDTEGPENREVVKGMHTTPERALQNLDFRVRGFLVQCVKDVGAANWRKLTLNQQIACLDICYNYGHIPIRIDPAEPNDTAARFAARGKDNGGVNLRRRRAEAELYLK